MDLRIESFENGPFDTFQVLAEPIDLEDACYCIHEAFVTFENFEWACDTVHRQEHASCAAGRRVRERKPLPMRKLSGPGDPERVKRSTADGNGIGGTDVVEAQDFGNSGCDGVRAERDVIK